MAAITIVPTLSYANCLPINQVYSWNVLNSNSLIAEGHIHQNFKLTFMRYCPNLPLKTRLGFRVIGGTGQSCVSRGDEVISRDMGVSYRCPIADIVPYTAEMEKVDQAAAVAKRVLQEGSP